MVPEEAIMNKIYVVRGHKVMFDSDLAILYRVPVKVLNQAVKRNIRRFPSDFMFQLNNQEYANLKSQIVTSSWGGARKLPFVFTEQGLAMLSGVLHSEVAIAANIQIMRAFSRLREMLHDNTELRLAIEEIRKKTENNSKNIELVFQYLDELLDKKEKQRDNNCEPTRIGYKT
jgi:hypothetical protein